MNRFKVLTMLFCFGLVASMMPSRANADEHDKKSIVTFSEPFEVPGVDAQILPAGTYMIKLQESLSDRNIVLIFNEDGTHIFTTILAIPNFRMRVTDSTVITFGERPAGTPPPIRTWFYPGDEWGQEFVYPKQRAIVLAKLANEPVPAIPDEVAAAPVETLKVAPIEAVKPTGEVVPVAAVVQAPPEATPEPAEVLPQTASQLPLLGLIGLLSLGVGATLLVFYKRSA
jgi:LPXTG-motif cell wall-anchored protein